MDTKQRKIKISGNDTFISLSGAHNLYNASLVVQIAENLGFSLTEISAALLTFHGVARRMQILADVTLAKSSQRIMVMDDYAHHPTEVNAVLSSLAGEYPDENWQILYFWELHRISRFCYFAEDFHATFEKFQVMPQLTLLPPFCAGEKIIDFAEFPVLIEKFRASGATVLEEEPSRFQWQEIIQKISKLPTNRSLLLVFLGAGNSTASAHLVAEETRLMKDGPQ